MPGLELSEGDVGTVMLEGLSLIAAELIFALNRVPGAITEVLLGLFDVVRDGGTAPSMTVRFELSDNLGHEIPMGTAFRLDLGPDVGTVDFTLDAGIVVAPGATQGTETATGEVATSIANGVAAETELELLEAIPYVDRVVVDVAVAGGVDPEDGDAFLDRGAQVLRRLVNTLVIPDHFTAAALLNAAVYRAVSLDNFDISLGTGVPGDHPGHISVLVAGPAGAVLDAGIKDAIDADLESKAQGNLAVHVDDPAITNVAVDVTVVRSAAYTDVQVIANVTAALQAYLNPDSWEWGRDVYRNELISVIDQVAGVDRVVVITAPAADVAIGVDGLVNEGAIDITVQAP